MCFFSKYFSYIGNTEAPMIYHRWAAISAISAQLGRNIHIPFGHSAIYPNTYFMLVGPPGARKGTAMGPARFLLKEAGYKRFAPDKVSKERFIAEMKPYSVCEEMEEENLELLILGGANEIYVMNGEFTDFVGAGNSEFITMLTNLWDCLSEYRHPKFHGKDTIIELPTVSILGASTAKNLTTDLPPNALGGGFLSRMVLIHSDATEKKIHRPVKPCPEIGSSLIQILKDIRSLTGEVTVTEGAWEILENIYIQAIPVDDPRFEDYAARRYTHLLKVCMILAASDLSTTITPQIVLQANTILYAVERRMPKALGEFGKARHSETSGAIIEYISRSDIPQNPQEIWKHVHKDLSKLTDLVELLKGLTHAGKIQDITINGKRGFLPLFQEVKDWPEELLDLSYLTEGELT